MSYAARTVIVVTHDCVLRKCPILRMLAAQSTQVIFSTVVEAVAGFQEGGVIAGHGAVIGAVRGHCLIVAHLLEAAWELREHSWKVAFYLCYFGV